MLALIQKGNVSYHTKQAMLAIILKGNVSSHSKE